MIINNYYTQKELVILCVYIKIYNWQQAKVKKKKKMGKKYE